MMLPDGRGQPSIHETSSTRSIRPLVSKNIIYAAAPRATAPSHGTIPQPSTPDAHLPLANKKRILALTLRYSLGLTDSTRQGDVCLYSANSKQAMD